MSNSVTLYIYLGIFCSLHLLIKLSWQSTSLPLCLSNDSILLLQFYHLNVSIFNSISNQDSNNN